MSQLGTQNKNL